jgi:hypothetical protein
VCGAGDYAFCMYVCMYSTPIHVVVLELEIKSNQMHKICMNDAMNSFMFLNLADVFAGTLDAFFVHLQSTASCGTLVLG